MRLKIEVNQLLLNSLLITEKLISITYVQTVDFHILVHSPNNVENFFLQPSLIVGQKEENW